ncbi:MAG: nuclear transport factor 2 family protein [Bacteroidetes bacterium]|nr:nuclear transport factor 2 family protein [Bacteroidota bacterium]
MEKMQNKRMVINQNEEITLSDVSKNILDHHLSSFLDSDLQAVMSDYTNESILITQAATYVGLQEIETFFVNLLDHFPKQQSSFELYQMVVKGELGYIVWKAKTPSLDVLLGSDTFIIKDRKIYQQTFVGKMKFID